MKVPVELPQGYYLDNFNLLLDGVEQQYHDLLSQSEQDFISNFRQLTTDSKKLYVRLVSRKAELFRLDKLNYPEISNIEQAATQLETVQLANLNPDIDLVSFCELVTKPELIAIFPDLRTQKSLKKGELVSLLQSQQAAPAQLSCSVLQLNNKERIRLFQLLFFGNLRQDLTEFVLLDLGLYHYEKYPISRDDRFFTSREKLDEYLHLYQQSETYWQLKETKDLEAICLLPLPPLPKWDRLTRRRNKLLDLIARDHERLENLNQAKLIYQSTGSEFARERLVRIHDKQGDHQAAVTLCIGILDNPESETEFDFATKFKPKVEKKLGLVASPAPKDHFSQIHLELVQTRDSVELDVASYFSSQGWQSYYSENTLINGLFGLLFWDIIFMPVSGAFFNAYQAGPKDQFTNDFYPSRAHQLESRLAELDSEPQLASRLEAIYQAKQGINNYWVNWSQLPLELLRLACKHFAPGMLKSIFGRLLFDVKNNRSGFPDLILFKDKKYLWLEVKGPGDKLQDNQKRWLRHFNQLGIPNQVCYVSWKNQED